MRERALGRGGGEDDEEEEEGEEDAIDGMKDAPRRHRGLEARSGDVAARARRFPREAARVAVGASETVRARARALKTVAASSPSALTKRIAVVH